MEYKREFQNIDTEAKAYFLGLMYADGCLSNKKTNYQKCIRLSVVDEQIIDDLHHIFPFMNKEKFDFGKYNKNCQIQYCLRKTSVLMFDDLINNGLFERKSYENKDFLKIPNINYKLIRHFIRGFFDGDGSINTSSKRPNGRRLEFCSVSEVFIKELHNFLSKEGIVFYKIREKKNSIQTLFTMEACKTDIVLKFFDFLYKDATIFLERKKEKFNGLRLIDRKESNPDCKICGCSSCVIKQTPRINKNSVKLKFKCKSCKKVFSILAQVKSDELLEKQETVNQQPS